MSKLILDQAVAIGEVGDPKKETVTYHVLGIPFNQRVTICNMRLIGVRGQWRIRRDGGDYEKHDYETAEAALAALQSEFSA